MAWALIIVGDGEIDLDLFASEKAAQEGLVSDLFETYQDYPDIPDSYDEASISEWILANEIDLIWTIREISTEDLL